MSGRIHIIDGIGGVHATIQTLGELVGLCRHPEALVLRDIANDVRTIVRETALTHVDVAGTAVRAGFQCRPVTPADGFAEHGDWVWWQEEEG